MSMDREWVWRCYRRRNKSPVFSTVMLALLHRFFQFFLVIGKREHQSRGAFRCRSPESADQVPAAEAVGFLSSSA